MHRSDGSVYSRKTKNLDKAQFEFATKAETSDAIALLKGWIAEEPIQGGAKLPPPPASLLPVTIGGQPYVGEVVDGKPSGKGTLLLQQGEQTNALWTGEFEEGTIADVEGVMQRSDGWTYQGPPPRTAERAEATIRWPDGSVYQGEVLGIAPDGKGEMTEPDGQKSSVVVKSGKTVSRQPLSATSEASADEAVLPENNDSSSERDSEICVPFDFGKDEPRADAVSVMDRAKTWKMPPRSHIQILGSADVGTGVPELAREQSRRRGEAVRDRLLQLGFNADVLQVWAMDVPMVFESELSCAVSVTLHEAPENP